MVFDNLYANCLEINKKEYNQKDFFRFLSSKKCEHCNLKSIDLVNSDFKNAILSGSDLGKANLSGSILDGSDLTNTDLSFTSLSSSSLRDVDLRGAKLNRTDLRNADLTGAILDYGALKSSYWDNTKGINIIYQSFEEVYNAGVEKYQNNKYREAELLFNKAIKKNKYKAKTLIAIAATKIKQERIDSAIEDLNLAANIYLSKGRFKESEVVKNVSLDIQKVKEEEKKAVNVNNKINSIVKGFMIMRMFTPIIP